jgi:iron complex transport system substrate-binding protein
MALDTAGCSASSSDPAPAATESVASGFPVTINHQLGTATIPAAPQRVVTIGFNE